MPILLLPGPIISFFNVVFPITRSTFFLKVRLEPRLPTSVKACCGLVAQLSVFHLCNLAQTRFLAGCHRAFCHLRMPERRPTYGRSAFPFNCTHSGFRPRAPIPGVERQKWSPSYSRRVQPGDMIRRSFFKAKFFFGLALILPCLWVAIRDRRQCVVEYVLFAQSNFSRSPLRIAFTPSLVWHVLKANHVGSPCLYIVSRYDMCICDFSAPSPHFAEVTDCHGTSRLFPHARGFN